MRKSWVFADPHFGHANIINFERTEFKTIEEHDDYIVISINKTVGKNDILYILGDVGDISRVKELNGYKILIMGNHDRLSQQKYLDAGFDEVYNHPIFVHKNIVLSHEPQPLNEYYINIHGHLHGAKLDSKNHFNVTARDIAYRPVIIAHFDKYLDGLPKIRAKFIEEWYAHLYLFHNKSRTDVIMDSRGKINMEETKKLRGMK